MPKAASLNRNIRHSTQIAIFMDVIHSKTTIIKNITAESTNPILQAKRFCGAPTYSGFWFLTNSRPNIRLGAYFGLIKILIKKSTIKKVTKICVNKNRCVR